MRAAAVKLTPLTEQEALFAEEHHDVIWKFLTHYRLEYGEYYGIAALGYLQAVKKWHVREDLHQYAFETIAWNNMRCHVGNERKKQERRIRTVSLDDMIPWTENLVMGCTVTEENVRFLYEKENTEMKVSYDIKVPEIAKVAGTKSVEIEMLLGFLDSSHKTMCLEYGDKKEAVKKAASLRGWKRNHKREDFELYRLDEKIYLEKTVKNGRKGKNNGIEN